MKKKIKYYTSFLYPDTDFFTGLGSIFNIYGNYYELNISHTGIDIDRKALECDWGMIGQDLIYAANMPDNKPLHEPCRK